MDDQGRPGRWWARLLFEPREMVGQEWWLGLIVLGLALGGAWLIFWPYLPTLIVNLFVGIFDALSWLGGLFSGGQQAAPTTAPVPTGPATGPLPSPSPSPSPSPLPR
jgi:hypothetical protein